MGRARVAINGFGRIGRLVARAAVEADAPVELVAVNDLAATKPGGRQSAKAATATGPEVLAHLLKYDSVHGRFDRAVRAEGDHLAIDGHRPLILAERDPGKLPWRELGVDYVVESTGKFTARADLAKHLDAGARRVFLSAPGSDVDVTIVRGVNDEAYDPARHRILSNASCTTNCLAPVLKVLHESFGVEEAAMMTVHAYTSDQMLIDGAHKDLRRARAAGLSMVPTTTGAARAIGLVLPALAGKVDGIAVRVPVANGSLLDLNARLLREAGEAEILRAFEDAAEGSLGGILGVEHDPLVSADFVHDARSAVVDAPALRVMGGSLVKVLAWYDNEWAYAMRLVELVGGAWGKETGRAEAPARSEGAASPG